CDSFLDCLPRGGRYFQEESSSKQWLRASIDWKEDRMSRKNGDRSRFDRQWKAKIHNRTRIRELWKTIRAQETSSGQNADRSGKIQGSLETTKKSTIKSADRGA